MYDWGYREVFNAIASNPTARIAAQAGCGFCVSTARLHLDDVAVSPAAGTSLWSYQRQGPGAKGHVALKNKAISKEFNELEKAGHYCFC